MGQFPEFIAEGLRRYPEASALLFSFSPFYNAEPADRAAVRSRAATVDTVIFCLANFNSLDVLEELKDLGRNVIVISALSPVYLSEVPWVKTAVAVYGDGRDSFRAGFGVLAGDYAATGLLPVNFPGPGIEMSWRQAGRRDLSALLEFLLPDEAAFVAITSRLRSGARGYEVYLDLGPGGEVRHSLLHTSAGLLLPAFSDPAPDRLELASVLNGLHPMVQSIMGIGRCVNAVEESLPLPPTTRVEYFLMTLSEGSSRPALRPEPPGLVVRKADSDDADLLFPLQKCYELEEVVITPAHFNDGQCLRSLRLALREQLVYLAELAGTPVAKAATNARGYRVDQIGGVYTVPSERGKGLGKTVVWELLGRVFSEKQEACLFVKKHNRSAIALYERLGFAPVNDYVISYYGL